jgi:hypothetical protein
MARQRIATYAMLTPERRLELLEKTRARRAARIAVGLHPDSLEQEEKEEEQKQVPNAGMEDAKPEEEKENQGKADLTPPDAGFSMADALAKFEVAQAEEATEQQAILDSIRSEAEVGETAASSTRHGRSATNSSRTWSPTRSRGSGRRPTTRRPVCLALLARRSSTSPTTSSSSLGYLCSST